MTFQMDRAPLEILVNILANVETSVLLPTGISWGDSPACEDYYVQPIRPSSEDTRLLCDTFDRQEECICGQPFSECAVTLYGACIP